MRSYCLAVSICFVAAACGEEGWPQYRGPLGDGSAASTHLVTQWSESDNVRWKTAIPGVAWSSPVAEAGTIWMTTAVTTEMSAEEQAQMRESDYANHMIGDALVFAKEVGFRVVGVDAESGELVHDVELFKIDKPRPLHSLNSYASPTPVIRDGRLYCHFGSYGTVCYDTHQQKMLWNIKLDLEESVGPGSSLALYQDILIIPCDGVDKQFVAGVSALTGQVVWETKRPPMEGDEVEYHKSFSTAQVIEHSGRTQAIVLGAQWIVSYDPLTGSEWWRFRHGTGFSCACRPVFGNGLVYVCTGYAGGRCLALDPSGSGELDESYVRWSHDQQVPTMSSPALVGNRLFFVSNRGVGTCLDATTGEQMWRARLGGNYCASPVTAGDKIYFCNREGQTVIVVANDTFQKQQVNELDGEIMASPMVLANDLIIRTAGHLYRVGSVN